LNRLVYRSTTIFPAEFHRLVTELSRPGDSFTDGRGAAAAVSEVAAGPGSLAGHPPNRPST
jgi:hypothetical protein